MKERRVTSQQVTKAGGLLPLVGQLVETLRKGSMEEKATAAMYLKALTEQAALHESKTNAVVIAEVRSPGHATPGPLPPRAGPAPSRSAAGSSAPLTPRRSCAISRPAGGRHRAARERRRRGL